MLAPTREIAMQIEQVISAIGQDVPGLVCHCAIGGLSVKADRKKVRNSHIIIGTPGRRHYTSAGFIVPFCFLSAQDRKSKDCWFESSRI